MIKLAVKTERRRFQRFRLNVPVIYTISSPDYLAEIHEDEEYAGRTLDLSEGNLTLLTDQYLPPKTFLNINIPSVNAEAHERLQPCPIRYKEDFEARALGILSRGSYFTVQGQIQSLIRYDELAYRLGIILCKLNQKQLDYILDLIYVYIELTKMAQSRKLGITKTPFFLH